MYIVTNKSELQQEETALVEAFRELRPEARHTVLAQAQAALHTEERTERPECPEQGALKQPGSPAV
ncbi:MAG: hypothetical protein LBF75_00295 [Treponema sp.]|jgi:hypothetical protein|nr:hypothetical protein [Treponema sp.]